MNDREPAGGIDLRAPQISILEVTTYPLAVVMVEEGGQGIADATHHLKIVLPAQNKEIRIPYNHRALQQLARQINRVCQREQADPDREGNHT